MTKLSKYIGSVLVISGVILYTMGTQIRFSANVFLALGSFLIVYSYFLSKFHGRVHTILRKWLATVTGVVLISLLCGEALVFSGMYSEVPENCKYVIVLGAGLSGDGPSVSLLGRLEAAVDYLNKNPHARVIASGGVGKESIYSEAEVMKWYFIDHGIAEERILKEEEATRTEENFKFGKQAIKNVFGEEPDAIAIATSDYHMFRSRLIAHKYYQRVYGISAVSPPIIKYNYALREYFALIKMGLWEMTDWISNK